MLRVTDTQDACEELARLLDKMDGGPRVGVHVGGGRHVDMPETWDGQGAVPPGWTSHEASVRQDPDDGTWSVLVDGAAEKLATTDALTPAEQDTLAQALARAVEPEAEPEEPLEKI